MGPCPARFLLPMINRHTLIVDLGLICLLHSKPVDDSMLSLSLCPWFSLSSLSMSTHTLRSPPNQSFPKRPMHLHSGHDFFSFSHSFYDLSETSMAFELGYWDGVSHPLHVSPLHCIFNLVHDICLESFYPYILY